jgi:hypothetical protein
MFKSLGTALFSSLCLSAVLTSGCGSDQALGNSSVIDRTTRPLSIGSILELNGSYDPACLQRGGSAWSLSQPGFESPTNAPLSVVLNDAGCTLYLTSFRVGTMAASELYLPPAPVPLGSSYLASGVPFRKDPQDPVAFYANVQIQPDLSFSGPFTVQAVYSEDIQATSLQLNSSSSVVSAQLAAAGVLAPDYVPSIAGLAYQVDAQGVVQSVSGSLMLSVQSVLGQSYVLDAGLLSQNPSYAELDAAFLLGVPMPLSGVSMIPAETFGLVGLSLAAPVVRNLILANETAGTRSYQMIRITFAQ